MRFLLIIAILCALSAPIHVFAQTTDTTKPVPESTLSDSVPTYTPPPPDEYFHARILSVTEKPYEPPKQLFQDLVNDFEQSLPDTGTTIKRPLQEIETQLTDGEHKDAKVIITQGGPVPISNNRAVKPGDSVIVVKTWAGVGEPTYHIVDFDRLPALGIIAALFFCLIIAFGRLKGFTSILGLVVSIAILTQFIVPRILAGDNPLAITLLGSIAIAITTLYLAHGFNRRTSIAVGSTLLTLAGAVGLATLFVSIAKLFGTGTEEALFVQFGTLDTVNLRGLLLSGMIIGTLGVLDDITTAQTAVVDELHKANPSLSRRELYLRGLSVGKEHIASLVNTLVLAYAGASLPIFLLFKLNHQLPFWLTLNSEAVAEEIVRTLVGSSALILAVPLATLLAAVFIPRTKSRPSA